MNEHPELGDDSSRNGGSSGAPTMSAGTPIPSSGKLRLTFNASRANGGSSGVQSDDDD